MYFALVHNPTGETVELRKLKGTDSANPEVHCHKWADQMGVTIAETNGRIPSGCAEYYAETRDHKFSSATCWQSFDFYLETSE